MIPCYSAALKKSFVVRFNTVFSYSIPQVSIQCLHSFIESWKFGQSLKFWGTYSPTKLVEFYYYMATAVDLLQFAVHSNYCGNI